MVKAVGVESKVQLEKRNKVRWLSVIAFRLAPKQGGSQGFLSCQELVCPRIHGLSFGASLSVGFRLWMSPAIPGQYNSFLTP
jgi:hypothetical protein